MFGLWGKLAAVGAAVVAVLTVLAYVRNSGRKAERLDTLEKTNDIIEDQRQAAADAPSDRRGVVDRLRGGSF